jgi:1-acyl-sn-glycerol-3-phosphate acyltransferase
MWRVRGLLFNILFYGSTLLLLSACVPLWLAPKSWQRRVPPVWLWVVRRVEKYVLGLDYVVIGRENLPKPPYLVAMKHQSAWETMKLYALFGNPAIVLKKELMDLPLWGRYAKAMDMVPVDRSKGKEATHYMVESAKQILVDKRPLVVFPQGTRVAVGDKRPYKMGIMKLYEALNVPVVPVALNAGVFWPRNAFWKRGGTITVEIMPPIAPGGDAQKVFAELQEKIETRSTVLAEQAKREFDL